MKKFLLILGIFFAFMPGLCFAEEEVYLELSARDVNLFNTGGYEYENKSLKSDDDDENYLKPSFGMFMYMFREDFAKDDSDDTSKHKKKQKYGVNKSEYPYVEGN